MINALLRWGSDDVKRRYLPQLAADTIGAYALSEAGSGSDAFALAARAAERDGDWVVTGRKLWITNGNEADLFIVFANINPEAGYRGITAFLVERGFAGFSVGKKEDKLGIRASSTCELMLEDCRVPRANVLGEVGKGYKIAIETLNEGRIGIGAQMIGVARGAWEYAAKYAQERKQFGKSIAGFPGHPVPDRADGDRDRGGAPAHVLRVRGDRQRAALRQGSGNGEVPCFRDGRARDLRGAAGVRRRGLHDVACRSSATGATRGSPSCSKAPRKFRRWSSRGRC